MRNSLNYLCAVLMMLGMSVNALGARWQKVTSVSELTDGTEVIITNNMAASASGYAMSTANNNVMSCVAVTSSSNIITYSGSDILVLTVRRNTSATPNLFAFWTGSGYLYDDGTKNHLKVNSGSYSDGMASGRDWCWTIDLSPGSNPNKCMDIKNNKYTSGTDQPRWLQYNSSAFKSSPTYNTYAQACIWKRACTEPITSFTPTSKAETYGGSNKTFTITAARNGSGTITWSTNNSSVATVSNGTVTVKGMGTATITYSVAANGGYCDETRTCTVNVTGEARTITFKANGGVGSDETQTVYYNTAATLRANTFTRSGYRFLGWNTDKDATTATKADKASVTTTTDITYYAIWKQQVTVTFKPNGGTPNTEYTQNVDISTSTTLDTHSYTKTGYDFLGFNTNSAATTASHTSGSSYSFAANTNLFAIFQAKTYTVTLNPNGGSGSNQTVTATYDAAMPSTLSGGGAIVAPTWEGHTFGGYEYNGTTYYNADLSSAHVWDIASNTTLTAKWTTNTPDLAVANMDHVSISATTPSVSEGDHTAYTYNNTVTLSHGDPDAGYIWGGWNVYRSGDPSTTVTVTSNQFTMPNYDVVVSANLYTDLKAWCATFEITNQAGDDDADVHLTSYKGVEVYATNAAGNLIRVQGTGIGGANRIYVSYLDENDDPVAKASSVFRMCNNGSSNYNKVDGTYTYFTIEPDEGSYDQTFSISYEPTEFNQIDNMKLKLELRNGTTPLGIETTLDLHGRSLPKEFVIAAKYADDSKWYALPNNTLASTEGSASAATPIEIEVDNTTTPTKVLNASNTLLYRGMDRYKPSPNTQFASIRFTSDGSNHLEASTGDSNYKLWLASGNAVLQNWYLKSSTFNAYEVQSDPYNELTKKLGFYNSSGLKMGFHGTAPKGADIYFLPVEYTDMEASIMEWGTGHVIIDLRDENGAVTVKTRLDVGALGDEQTLGTIKKDAGVYRLNQTLSASDAAKELKLYFYDGGGAVVGTSTATVPLLITDDDATTSGFSITKDDAATCDLVVLNGAVLTVSESSDGDKYSFKDLYVYGGGKMVVPSGKYIAFDHVILRGGHLNSSWQYQYSHPQLVLNGTMSNAADEIYYDYLTNNAQFYSLALPYDVTLTDIVNPYFSNKRSWIIHGYDGALRASGSQVNGWYDVEVGTTNIAPLTDADDLTAGVGYTFFGAMQKVGGVRQKWSVNRFKMTLTSGSAEEAKSGVAVTAHGMTDGELNDGVAPNDAGWNMLGNPYLADIDGTAAFESGEQVQGKILSYHNVKVLDANDNWTGAWEWVANEANVRYVRIPNNQGTEYEQVRFKDANLRAFHHFFIQASESGTFSFSIGMRVNEAPARFKQEVNKLPDEMDVDLILSNGGDQVGFGLTVNNEFSASVEIGEDMQEDLVGTNMKAYTIMDNVRLTFNGLPAAAAENLIPVGYRVEYAGYYTFQYKEDKNASYIEHLWLTDKMLGNVVDLKEQAYEFTTESGIFDERFALNVVFAPQTPTDIDNSYGGGEQPQKFIYRGKMFILRNGVIYDATGKKVKEINK